MPTRELPVPAFYRPEHASLFAYRPDPAALLDEATRFRRAHVLKDAMSAVTVPDPARAGAFLFDFTPHAEEAFGRWREAGMHLVDTATPLSEWPGFPSA